MPRTVKRWLQIILFSIAILLIASGALGYWLTIQSPKQLDDAIKLAAATDSKQLRQRQKQATYDKKVDFATGDELAEARKHYQETINQYAIGVIAMPDADIRQPILAGTGDYNLFNGVGTDNPNQRLGQGLWIGLSHNLLTSTQLLDPIDQLEPNDEIYATDFDTVYVYRITNQEVVRYDDPTFLKPPKSDEPARILLYRCEGEVGTIYRRVVVGELMNQQPLENATEKERQILGLPSRLPTPLQTEEKKKKTDNPDNYEQPAIEPLPWWQTVALSVYQWADRSAIWYSATVSGILLVLLLI